MLFDDPFEHLGAARMVPDPLRPDDRDPARGTDPQAIGLGPGDPLFEPAALDRLLEMLPRAGALAARAALTLFTLGADEDVAANLVAAGLGERGLRLFDLAVL